MSVTAAKSIDTQPRPSSELTDGFNLIIDALKLNGLDHDLWRAGHPDHGFRPHGAGRGHPRDLVPSRAERRQRRRRSPAS